MINQSDVTQVLDQVSPQELPDFFMAVWGSLNEKRKQYGNGGSVLGSTRTRNPQAQILNRAVIACGKIATELHEFAINTEQQTPQQGVGAERDREHAPRYVTGQQS